MPMHRLLKITQSTPVPHISKKCCKEGKEISDHLHGQQGARFWKYSPVCVCMCVCDIMLLLGLGFGNVSPVCVITVLTPLAPLT